MAFGFWEFLLTLLIVALLFGSRFAQLGRGLGEGIRNFKAALGKGKGARKKRADDGAV